jgi:exodeoxyribonuclease-3
MAVRPPTLRVLTWNVARRTSRLVEQATALGARDLDVLALQEVTAQSLPLWQAACSTLGLVHVASSLERADPARAPAARRHTGVLIASRTSLTEAATQLAVPWPETALGMATETTPGPVEVHCVHVPNAANGWVKVRTLQAIREGLEAAPPGPRVLCGDLNTPRRELADGKVVSFGRDSRGRLRRERGEEWDDAELGVVPGLRDLGYRDAFRTLHGYRERSPSWTWRQIAGHDGGWRLDHLFASAELRPLAALYHHAWRDDGLSDHAALEVELARESEAAPSARPSA